MNANQKKSVCLKTSDISHSNINTFPSFNEVGGLSDHIKLLKEIIILPLVYTNVYNKFNIRPPRGVIFHGPPGTGKTLVAAALAKECSRQGNFGKVTFFSRKGADILDKWVGESEQRLRKLFLKASQKCPSIIFFDEIDGLAPIRSSRQDQVHASVVSTLLALMDGLDKMPGVVIIGATNRLDAIDPALRRPGRFDRELYFSLPAFTGRKEILEVHVRSWAVKPKPMFLTYLADITVGFSGSDLQALCSEAVMTCLRRCYPKIHSTDKINIRLKKMKVLEKDFMLAKSIIMPSTNRDVNVMRQLSPIVAPLLQNQLNKIISLLKTKCGHFVNPHYKYHVGSERYTGRLLIIGGQDQGHNTHVAPAILHAFEHLQSFVIDIKLLCSSASKTAEERCVQMLTQAKQNTPCIILAYRMDEWWNVIEECTRAVFMSVLEDLNASLPLLIIATVSDNLPLCLANFFNKHSSIVYKMKNPNDEERYNFLYHLFMVTAYEKCIKVGRLRKKRSAENILSIDTNQKNSGQNVKRKNVDRDSKHVMLQTKRQKCTCSSNNKSSVDEVNKNNKKSSTLILDNTSSNTHMQKIVESSFCRKSSNLPMDEIVSSRSAWNPLAKALHLAKQLQVSFTNLNSCSDKNLKTHFVNSNYSNEEHTLITERSFSIQNELFKPVIKDTSGLSSIPEEDISTEAENINRRNNRDNLETGDFKISETEEITNLFNRAVNFTSQDTVARMELLYDMLSTCINRENQTSSAILENINNILNDFE